MQVENIVEKLRNDRQELVNLVAELQDYVEKVKVDTILTDTHKNSLIERAEQSIKDAREGIKEADDVLAEIMTDAMLLFTEQ